MMHCHTTHGSYVPVNTPKSYSVPANTPKSYSQPARVSTISDDMSSCCTIPIHSAMRTRSPCAGTPSLRCTVDVVLFTHEPTYNDLCRVSAKNRILPESAEEYTSTWSYLRLDCTAPWYTEKRGPAERKVSRVPPRPPKTGRSVTEPRFSTVMSN